MQSHVAEITCKPIEASASSAGALLDQSLLTPSDFVSKPAQANFCFIWRGVLGMVDSSRCSRP